MYPPKNLLTCLFIDGNTIDNTITILEANIQTIHAECTAIYGKSRITKHTFQYLLGKLLYVHKCVAPAHMFVNRILPVFMKNSCKKSINLDDEFQKDLAWFLPEYNAIDKQKL